jgi:putative SOS response-associated peptidase YedK
MCYSFTPIADPDSGNITWIPPKVRIQLEREGKVRKIEPRFPGDIAEFWRWVKDGIESRQGRFDLVPRFFKTHLSLSAMLAEKNSRRKDSEGFSSHNARSESMLQKPTWKGPWRERKRMVIPISEFRERANAEDAPIGFKGREFAIRLDSQKNLAGIYDRWENETGEVMESFGIITVPSKGNALLESIWHPRCPLILDNEEVERWLDPETTPEQALRMVKLYPSDKMTLKEIIKDRSAGNGGSTGPEDQQLSLF